MPDQRVEGKAGMIRSFFGSSVFAHFCHLRSKCPRLAKQTHALLSVVRAVEEADRGAGQDENATNPPGWGDAAVREEYERKAFARSAPALLRSA